ncbi:hypothetical protein [Flavobacterium cerinum]|uniref:TMF family protein n=1 Tax=Flavobacterium cerinum TaxID=2502784 RepID=A0ABY5ISV3_9FLAO|nr:hypothetical protein [Flavobacterium cerinum]UUC45931.1 hypothetical protein NOX80_01710 [Flavobacterium cerinum]
MKTKLLLTGFFLSGFLSLNAQNVASNSTVTSGGLQSGSNGEGNTFYGYQAGMSTNNVTFSDNTFIGHSAGKTNTSGKQNVFIGNHSGIDNITGTNNLFIGYGSGSNNTTGNQNTYIGSLAGAFAPGTTNTFIGYNTGRENQGNNNTFIGAGAGAETTGSGNVLIGTNVALSYNIDNKLYIDNKETDTPLIWGDFVTSQLKLNGKVGIGTNFGNFPTTAGGVNLNNYSLFVKGGILTEEVRVNLQSAWADYVFQPEYQLPTLNEVEKHIQEKGHLINVPSAAQVASQGIALGEMIKIQQEKIEELTLYIIEQNKTNEKQAKDIEELKKLVNNLTNNK